MYNILSTVNYNYNLYEFYIHVTVQRNKFIYNKTN